MGFASLVFVGYVLEADRAADNLLARLIALLLFVKQP